MRPRPLSRRSPARSPTRVPIGIFLHASIGELLREGRALAQCWAVDVDDVDGSYQEDGDTDCKWLASVYRIESEKRLTKNSGCVFEMTFSSDV